jgi:hypothetical protein
MPGEGWPTPQRAMKDNIEGAVSICLSMKWKEQDLRVVLVIHSFIVNFVNPVMATNVCSMDIESVLKYEKYTCFTKFSIGQNNNKQTYY